MRRLSWADWCALPILVGVIGGVAWAAFARLGFLGLGLLGLVIGIIAVNLELQDGRALGSGRAPEVFAQVVAAEDAMRPGERAARRADRARAALPLFVAKVASAGLIIIGFGLFFTFQLRP